MTRIHGAEGADKAESNSAAPDLARFSDPAIDNVVLQLVSTIKLQRAIIDAMTGAAHEQDARIRQLEDRCAWLEGVLDFCLPTPSMKAES